MRAFKSCFCLKNARKQLGIEDLTILASETLFTINEIEALYDMFKKLSSSIINDAFIQKEELLLALFRNSSKKNIFADRIFDLFDNKHNGVIDFEQFVRTMSIFHPNASEEDKIAFAFRLYDLRQTGYIEREEVILTKISETRKRCLRAVIKKLKEMVTAILSESDMTLSDDNIEYIVNKTIIEADLKDDGKIDHEEWKQLVMKNPSLIKNMTVPCLKEITLAFPNFVVNTEVPD